jgi:hypothetical protein
MKAETEDRRLELQAMNTERRGAGPRAAGRRPYWSLARPERITSVVGP